MHNPENIENIWSQVSYNLKAFIMSKVKNEADTEDILQETFLKIHQNFHTLKNKSRVESWIYQITRNQIIDHFRSNQEGQKIKAIRNEFAVSTSVNRYMISAIRDMIEMMDELPPEYCEALCLTEIEGMSQKEFAEIKGLSYSGAKSRVQRARIMLKDMLLKCCHYQFDKYGTVIDIQPKCCCCCNSV